MRGISSAGHCRSRSKQPIGQGRGGSAGQLQGNREIGSQAVRDAVRSLRHRVLGELLRQPGEVDDLARAGACRRTSVEASLISPPGSRGIPSLAHWNVMTSSSSSSENSMRVERSTSSALTDQPEAVLDLLVDLVGRQVDEAGGEVGEQAFERHAVVRRPRFAACSGAHGPGRCVSHTSGRRRVDLGLIPVRRAWAGQELLRPADTPGRLPTCRRAVGRKPPETRGYIGSMLQNSEASSQVPCCAWQASRRLFVEAVYVQLLVAEL